MGIMFPVDFAVFSVTVSLISGQSGGKHVLYVSLDVCCWFFFYIRSTFSVHNLTSIFPIVSFRLLLFSFLFMFLQTAHTATGRNRGPGVFPGTRWDVDRQSPRSNSSPSGVEKTGSSHNPAVIHAVSTLSGPPCSLSLTRLFLSPWKRSQSSQSRNFRRGFLVLNSTLPPYLCHLAFRLESSDCNVLER